MYLVATWLLFLAVVLVMTVSAVFGYALWNIALWWLDSRNDNKDTPTGRAQPRLCGLDVRRRTPPARHTAVTVLESPPRDEIHWHHNSQRVRIHSGSAGSQQSSSASGPRLPVVDRDEQLRRGFASQLALRFSGDLGFHTQNVEAITHIYEMKQADICYCFLCLEEAASEGNTMLALKKWGTGVYSARLWVVALARFVMAAQQRAGALEVARLEPLCAEWQYKSEHFVREVQSMEALFHRRHGKVLMAAFGQTQIRNQEVIRALQVLCQQGEVSAPHSSRLSSGGSQQPALSSTAAQPMVGQTLPALPDCRPARPRMEVASPPKTGTRKRWHIQDINDSTCSKRRTLSDGQLAGLRTCTAELRDP